MSSRRQFLRASALVPSILGRSRSLFAAEAQYDLVIRGGRVVDPSQRMDRVADVAIRDGKIAAIRPNVAASLAKETIDAAGKVVTPGLIDIHAHVAEKDLSPASCMQDGVTAVLDAGSRGFENVDDLLKTVQNAPNHARILLNIGHLGVEGKGELHDINNANAAATRAAIERNRQWIVGIKARLSRTVAGENDLEALRRARQAADPLKVPIMVHIGDTVSPLPDILALLRPGDIVTHMYSPPPHGIMDDNGMVLPQVREARRRGVNFDIGNGRLGHLRWDVVESAFKQGFLPDTISSDLTAATRTFQVFNLPTVVSKFLMLGMPLDKAIACVTATPARIIPEFKAYGTLRTGAAADVAVFDLQQGDFEFVDNYEGKRSGKQKLVPYAVVVGGKRMQA